MVTYVYIATCSTAYRYLIIWYVLVHVCHFYRAMHYNALQSAVLRLHVVHLTVRLSVCDVGGLWSHRLEILETNCKGQLAQQLRSL